MSTLHVPAHEAELATLLRDQRGRVHLQGSGSRRGFHPQANEATRISLRGMDRIVHFEPGDLTCSVQAGLPMAALRAELQPHAIELACLDGEGTVGGLFASDPWGAWTPGGATPRSLLLGMDALLADGTQFRSGSRVVKSVAGFDLHKLFVGSAGSLMAATVLHLRLHPAPRARIGFEVRDLTLQEAVSRFHALRHLATRPEAIVLEGTANGAQRVHGRFGGRPASILRALAEAALTESDPTFVPQHLDPRGDELLTGMIRASRLQALLQALPAGSRWTVRGGMRFELAIPPADALAALERVAAHGGHARIHSADTGRDGRSTPTDPGAALVTERLRKQLDPGAILS
ncbi:MAG: hypothetical protein RIT25_2427 [Planctomycetota bacterium]